MVLVLLIVGAAAGGGYWYLRNQVPSSAVAAALPGGTDLSAELLSLSEPEGDSQSVTAQAAIGGAAPVPDTTLVYVIDLSRTTLEGPGCGGDPNRDGLVDTPLDCEIAAATGLNAQAVENGTVGAVGLVGFAGGATTADLSPEEGIQVLTAPAQDDDQDGITNVVEALESAYSAGRVEPVGFRVFTPVSTQTRSTEFSAGITAACQVMDETELPNRLVVFLSDGRNRSGDPLASVLPCDAATVFQTFAVGAEAGCEQESELGGLQEIADLTDGLCTTVVDLTRLPEILESVVLPQILRIQLALDGGDPIDISREASPQPPEAGPIDDRGGLPDPRAVGGGARDLHDRVRLRCRRQRARSRPARRWTPPEDASPPTSGRPDPSLTCPRPPLQSQDDRLSLPCAKPLDGGDCPCMMAPCGPKWGQMGSSGKTRARWIGRHS